MHKHLIFWSVSFLTGALAACAGSQAEQVKDARMEQSEANADATEQAVENRAATREESLDRAYDAREQNVAEANPPGEGATQELIEVSKNRTVYQSEAQTRVDKLGVRLEEAEQKIGVLGTRAPTSLKTELETAEKEYQLLKQDVMKLNDTPTTEWEATTSKIEDRIASLDERVEELKESIDDVGV